MDDSEFIEWVAGHQRHLLRSAYLLTGGLHRAQDLVQEAMVKVALRWAKPRTRQPHGVRPHDPGARQRLVVASHPS